MDANHADDLRNAEKYDIFLASVLGIPMGRFHVIVAKRMYQHIDYRLLLPPSNASRNTICPHGYSRGTQNTRKDKGYILSDRRTNLARRRRERG